MKITRIILILCIVYALTFIGIAVYFKIAGITHRMQWFDDSARDTLVAESISYSNRYINVQPKALGFVTLKNTGIYYNVLALVRKIADTRSNFIYLYAIISILLTVIPAFILIYTLWGVIPATLASILLIIHPTLDSINISVYQRHLISSLTLLYVLFSVMSVRRQSFVVLLATTFLYFFLVSIHYSALTFAFVHLIVMYFVLRNKSLKYWVIMIFQIDVLIILWIMLAGINFHELSVALNSSYARTCYICPSKIWTFFGYLYSGGVNAYIHVIILFASSIYFFIRKKSKEDIVLFLFTMSYFISIFALGIMGKPTLQFSDYFKHYVPIFLLAPLWNLGNLQYHKIYAQQVVAILFLFMTISNSFVHFSHTYGEYDFIKTVTYKIIEDNKKDTIDTEPYIIDYTSWAEPDWFSPSFDYFLYGDIRNYAMLRNTGNNIIKTYHKGMTIYLVCRYLSINGQEPYSNRVDSMQASCLMPYLKKHESKYGILAKDLRIDTFYTDPTNPASITIFKLKHQYPHEM